MFNTKEKYKICILGAHLKTGNLGVSALAASLVNIFSKLNPKSEVVLIAPTNDDSSQKFYIEGKEVNAKVISYRLTPKAGIQKNIFYIFILACIQHIIPRMAIQKKIIFSNPLLKAMYEANIVGQINGGDSFSDIYGIKRMIVSAMPSLIAELLKKKFILFPQTYGPYNTLLGKTIAKFIVSICERIYSRDLEGLKEVGELLKNKTSHKNVQFCPDVAFMLNGKLPDQINIYPPIENVDRKHVIGLNVSGLLYSGGYTQDNMFGLNFDYKDFAYRLSRHFLEHTYAHLLLVPHTTGLGPEDIESDPYACKHIIERLIGDYKHRVHIVQMDQYEYNQSEIKGIIGLCDFFVGSRMHACIAALSQSIPTVGVAYSKKFKGVFNSVGAGDFVVDARNVKINDAIDFIMQTYHNRNNISQSIAGKVNEIKGKIMSQFRDAIIN